ncbi:MAG: hypothetical protein KAI83_06785 [Thiomargarita sp.]|nr:hypothetical protein [Thiomargarita sp.]
MEYNALALSNGVQRFSFVNPSKKRPKLKRWTPKLKLMLTLVHKQSLGTRKSVHEWEPERFNTPTHNLP